MPRLSQYRTRSFVRPKSSHKHVMHSLNRISIAVSLLSSIVGGQYIDCEDDEVTSPMIHSPPATVSETQPVSASWVECEDVKTTFPVQTVTPTSAAPSKASPSAQPTCHSAGCLYPLGHFSQSVLWPNTTGLLTNGTVQPSASTTFPRPSIHATLAGIVSDGAHAASLDYRLLSAVVFSLLVVVGCEA